MQQVDVSLQQRMPSPQNSRAQRRHTRQATKLLIIIALNTIILDGHASAEELWDPYLRGVNEGVPAGALPPPGVYGVLDNYWTNYKLYNSNGKTIPGTGIASLVEVPIILWVPGIKVLGADYAAAIAEPFDYTSSSGLSGSSGMGNWGAYNTILIPAQLAWNFNNLYVKAGVTVYLPTASSTLPDLIDGKLKNGGVPSGNGFTTVQPDLGISWLQSGWNLSANMHLAIPITADTARNYKYWSGDEFAADYTIAKSVGKWTFGVGIHQENQLNADTKNGKTVIGSTVTNFGAGPLIGYQFSEVGVMAEWNHNIYTKNDVAGDFFNLRLVVPF